MVVFSSGLPRIHKKKRFRLVRSSPFHLPRGHPLLFSRLYVSCKRNYGSQRTESKEVYPIIEVPKKTPFFLFPFVSTTLKESRRHHKNSEVRILTFLFSLPGCIRKTLQTNCFSEMSHCVTSHSTGLLNGLVSSSTEDKVSCYWTLDPKLNGVKK